jgi:FMN phosphatase YigB (HAD superfamily)
MIRAVIFDLDNCLCAADEVGRDFYKAAFDAIARTNDGTVSDAVLQQAFDEIWRQPLDVVAEEFGFSKEMLAAGQQAFSAIEIDVPLRGYSDLQALADLPVLRFLVTSGYRRLQESKIKALGIRNLFSAIYIDAIDEPGRNGKQQIFQKILRTYLLRADEVLVVGDSPSSEIEAGNRLGIPTVQILRPGVPRGNNATCYIHDLSELKSILQQSQKS